jgi:hypothetical protein
VFFIETEGLGFGRHSKLIWTKRVGLGAISIYVSIAS